MRLFFAVALSHRIKSIIEDGILRLSIVNPPWRWVAAENLHVTMKFLGEAAKGQEAPLFDCAAEVCRDIAPFRIRLGSLSGFPGLERPRVLFYRIEEGAGPLRALSESLDAQLSRRLSISPEKRPFRAHVTIARVKKPPYPDVIERLRQAPALENALQEVESIVLMRSELRRDGARYEVLKEFALSKSKC